MQIRSRLIGFAVMACEHPFPGVACRDRSTVPSMTVRTSRSSFRPAPPPQSAFTAGPRMHALSSGVLDLPGFPSSSRPHPNASTIREASQFPALFRPQAFAASRRFPPRSGSQACFIPLPRPGCSRSGCSPLAQPPSLIERSLPPCRCSSRAHRPRSAATRNAPDFEASICTRMRSPG